jgi:DNA-binding MarR family transcriptional regulator
MFIAAPPLSRETMNRVVGDSRPVFTPRQGQYLAFIHAYTLVNGRPPAQADMQRFFRLTPPSVHQMLVALERAGLISRQPGVARSYRRFGRSFRLTRLGTGLWSTGQNHCAEVLGDATPESEVGEPEED